MTKMQKTAKGLDIFFKILQIIMVAAVIIFCLITAWLLLNIGLLSAKGDLPAKLVTASNILELGYLQLAIAPEYLPSDGIMTWLVPVSVLGILTFGLFWLMIRVIRKLLGSMAQGLPFYETAWKELRRLALLVTALGLLDNAGSNLMQYGLSRSYGVQELLLSDKITHVAINYTLDLSFLLYGFLLLLLAYVFRYGAELQVQVDETV